MFEVVGRDAPSSRTMAESKVDQLVATWKKLHIASKQIQPQLEQTREDVTKLIVESGADHIVTKLGTIGLQHKTSTDWEALARHFLSAAVIDASVGLFKKQSDPFVCAPREWGFEARAKAKVA
jgi:hypothetical protein